MKGIVINLDSRLDRWERFQQNKFPFPIERFPAIIASCGEDGCTQSHLQVLSKQKEFPFIIFEDDCVMLQPWSVIEEAMKQLPKKWDALWLGANLRKPIERHSDNLFRLKKAYCLHAVIYNSKRMVDFILNNHNTLPGKNLDIYICKVIQQQFNCFIVDPLCATQLSDKSDIANVETNNFDEIQTNFKRFTECPPVLKV